MDDGVLRELAEYQAHRDQLISASPERSISLVPECENYEPCMGLAHHVTPLLSPTSPTVQSPPKETPQVILTCLESGHSGEIVSPDELETAEEDRSLDMSDSPKLVRLTEEHPISRIADAAFSL